MTFAPDSAAAQDLAYWQTRARACGISEGYYDIWGQYCQVPTAGLRSLVAAIAPEASEAGSQTPVESVGLLPSYVVLWSDQAPWQLNVPVPEGAVGAQWQITEESGAVRGGVLEGNSIHLPPDLPVGYHQLQLGLDGQLQAACLLIHSPGKCYQAQDSSGQTRHWGPSVQLYALRSQRNWGIGDFTDLIQMMPLCASAGAALVGLNPLHALYPHNPEHASPYSPSSRRFGNFLYLDVESVPDFARCTTAQQLVGEADFQAQLTRLRGLDLVDYSGVARLKTRVLEHLYTHFCTHHLNRPDDARALDFAHYCKQQGEALRQHALFEALQAHFFAQDAGVWGWPAWPKAYQDPNNEAVTLFEKTHADRVGFYRYLQWEFSRQLALTQDAAKRAGLPLGLYRDLAVSIDEGGAQAWGNQHLYARAASAGCPPDDFNLNGQDWGLLPQRPQSLIEAQFAPFIADLRASMQHAGALRLDHVMGLARLFWVPRGQSGTLGSYVSYPFEALLAIVALESQRHACVVIGEDLGTVTDEVRIGMQMSRALSYRVLYFSFDHSGKLPKPESFPVDALVTCTTHDLATLRGYWEGRDIEVRQQLQLFPREGMYEQQWQTRQHHRQQLLMALADAGLWTVSDPNAPLPEMNFDLVEAIHRYLASTPARLLTVQLEDILGCQDQVNLPGTVQEYANWRRRLPITLERWAEDGRFQKLGQALAQHGRGLSR